MTLDSTNFVDARFPEKISFRGQFGPTFNTVVLTGTGGGEKRLGRWSAERFEANVAHLVKNQTEFDELSSMYRAVLGMEYTWRYKDWSDYTIGDSDTSTPQFIGTGDGTTKTFPVVKRYSFGSRTYERPIQGLVSGTVRVFTEETTEGPQEVFSGYTVDHANGNITFTVAPTSAVHVYVICEFDIVCRFNTNKMVITHESYNNYDWPDIPIIEVKKTTG